MSTNTGSSPRGRGKLSIGVSFRVVLGLIPAWAGKTGTRAPRLPRGPAHPRVGGENQSARSGTPTKSGSSPRGRGKLVLCLPSCVVTVAHPRVGGENEVTCVGVAGVGGSSPRGRGKRDRRRERRTLWRLIPAWAGKTAVPRCRTSRRPAHPRVGGENAGVAGLDDYGRGSSPRGRGKRMPSGPPLAILRLIPAWAGKTPGYRSCFHTTTAHPRVGGENEAAIQAGADTAGSSPRGRGKLKDWSRGDSDLRLIPAWAGKTLGNRS